MTESFWMSSQRITGLKTCEDARNKATAAVQVLSVGTVRKSMQTAAGNWDAFESRRPPMNTGVSLAFA